ncbi:DMT family transporter [Tahibacter caeni]|uniref:DMT family transporter n=1 Tax=Tahibacter caeni TaxID=1453545 RepID=UPI00214887EF|nr:DMT family transporter [Tahibacter caeni]
MSEAPLSRSAYRRGLLIAAAGAVLFSAKAIVAKLLYRHPVDALDVLALRMLYSAPFFVAIAAWQWRSAAPLSRRDRLAVLVLGLLGYYLSSYLDFAGLQYVSAALERLILFLSPSFVLLISALVLRRRIGPREWAALALAYAGIVFVFAHDLSLGGDRVVLGALLVFGAALSYALYLIGSGELVKRLGPWRLVAYAMSVSTIAVLLHFAATRPWSRLLQPWPVQALSVFNAMFCTVAPVLLTMFAVARIGAPAAAQAGMLGPVSTVFLGAWLLQEPVTLWQLAGSALVLAGMYVLSLRKT